MITLKPDTSAGHFVLLTEEGDPVGMGIARPSKKVPGYVTLVILQVSDGTNLRGIRVPSDWLYELKGLPAAEL